MARKDWSDYFAASYGSGGFDKGAELAFNKWKAERELEQTNTANKLALAKLEKDLIDTNRDWKFKQRQEARRDKEAKARTAAMEKRSELFDKIFSGGNGGGIGGGTGNVPPGTSVNAFGLNIPLNRRIGDTEAKTMSQAGAMLSDLKELRNMFTGGEAKPGAQMLGSTTAALQQVPLVGGQLGALAMGLGGIGKSGEKRQNYSDLLGNISERLLRLRSGAQINEQEYKRFVRMMPSLMRGDKLDIKQLDRFISEFSALEGRLSSGALWDKKSGKFSGGQATPQLNLDTLFSDLEAPKEE